MMFFDVGHPLVSRKDWLQFSSQLSPYFSQAIDRETLDLPYWFLPLSRGVVVAGPLLLHRTGYRMRRGLLPDWKRVRADVYQRSIGKTRLRVRRTNDRRAWIISRWRPGISMHSDVDSETLAHRFGATPLVTGDLNEALHLAYWFEVNGQLLNLRWVKVSPGYLIGALAFAMHRAKREGTKLSWNDLWASNAHSRRMKLRRGNQRHAPLLPPVVVRIALRSSAQSQWHTVSWTIH
jgi:hypothetical protein